MMDVTWPCASVSAELNHSAWISSATVAHKTGFNAVLSFQPLSKALQGLVQTRILRLQQLGQIASVQR